MDKNMIKLKFNKARIEKLVCLSFPKAEIIDYNLFSTGLVSSVFKVELKNPSKIIVVKLGQLKNANNIHKNNQILDYLNKKTIPTPKVYFEGIQDKKYITIMELSTGDVAINVYKAKDKKLQRNILFNAGRSLKKIHNLEILPFWNHRKHDIRSSSEWKNWTIQRVEKYLKFLKKKLPQYFDFLETELTEFLQILNRERIDLMPLHWDYHLSNLNVNKKGEITGVFDFDNAMKGHNLADIGLAEYWIAFENDGNKDFKYFLSGYKKTFSKKELKLIKGYFILQILAVSRTIWFRKNLTWIIDRHKQMLLDLEKEY